MYLFAVSTVHIAKCEIWAIYQVACPNMGLAFTFKAHMPIGYVLLKNQIGRCPYSVYMHGCCHTTHSRKFSS